MEYDEFKTVIVNDIAIVTVDLLVATQRDAKPLWEELESTGILDWKKVIIDLSACTFVDSTFLGMVVRIIRTMSKNSCQLKLVFPENNARPLFATTGIISIVSCYDTLREAIRSFESKTPASNIPFGTRLHLN